MSQAETINERAAAIALDTARAARIAATDALIQAEARRTQAAADVEAAKLAVTDARIAYRASPDDAEEEALTQANIRLTKARVRLDVLTEDGSTAVRERLDVAAAGERQAELRLTYEAARRKRDAAAELLAREYPKLGAKLVQLVMTMGEAAVAVSEANAILPQGCPPLAEAEAMIRDSAAETEEVLIVRQEPKWSYSATRLPVDAAAVAEIKLASEGRGKLATGKMGEPTDVEVMMFDVETFHPSSAARYASRLAELSFPGLRPDTYYLKACGDRFASADQAIIGRPEDHKPSAQRPTLTRTRAST